MVVMQLCSCMRCWLGKYDERIKHILYWHVNNSKFCMAYLIPVLQRYIIRVCGKPCLQSTYTPLQHFIFQALQPANVIAQHQRPELTTVRHLIRWIITPTYFRCGFLSNTIAIAWIRAMSFACSSLTLTVWDINKKWAYYRLVVLKKHWTDNI